MTIDQATLGRLGDLKESLVNELMRGRHARRIGREIHEVAGNDPTGGAVDVPAVIDEYLLERREPDGRTVLEHLLDKRPDISPEDRARLLAWGEVVTGVFRVERRTRDHAVLHNLVDDLTYEVYSSAGPAVFRQMPPRSYLFTRIVPIEDAWMFSASQRLLPASQRQSALATAYQLLSLDPTLSLRNPALRERAVAMLRAQEESFSAYFGADLIVVPGVEAAERLNDWLRYHFDAQRADDGARVRERGAHHESLTAPAFPAGEYDEFATVGVYFHPVGGLTILLDYGSLQELFADPSLLNRATLRRELKEYLEDETIPNEVIRRLAAAHAEHASAIFARVLGRKGFDWQRDGEAYLDSRRSASDQPDALPGIVVVPDEIASWLRGRAGVFARLLGR